MKMELFQHPQFGEIHTAVSEDGKPLFKANDIANALGYSQPKVAVSKLCKGVTVLETPTENQYGTVVMQPIRYIKEADVYRLVMRSKLPEAERFQDWVVEEVLPCIRKHGAYMTDIANARALEDPDYIIRLATLLKEEKEEIRKAKEKEEADRLLIEEQKKTIGELSERVSYVDHVLSCPNLICITQIAQDYGMTAYALNRLLAEMRIQYRVNRQWILFAEYKDLGYVQSCTTIERYKEGRMWTCWTQKGRLFLYEMLKKRGILPLMEKRKEAVLFDFEDSRDMELEPQIDLSSDEFEKFLLSKGHTKIVH